jgi:tetratricopeptide (TPR) repeat protein
LLIRNEKRLLPAFIIMGVAVFALLPIKQARGVDCDNAVPDAKRLYNMAQEQLKVNIKASEDFLLQALGSIGDCEYSDELKQELYTALGQLYYKEGKRNEAIDYLGKAIESGMNIESPNSFPAVLLGKIYAENANQDVTFFPGALLNYKKALDIGNFASSALAKQAEEEYKQLEKQISRMEARIWETARGSEAGGKWDTALKCYDSLALLGRYDKLAYYKNRARFNILLNRADAAMADLNFQEAGLVLDKAASTGYYVDGYGKNEFDKRLKRLKRKLKQ